VSIIQEDPEDIVGEFFPAYAELLSGIRLLLLMQRNLGNN
jgi:hypothetical protein